MHNLYDTSSAVHILMLICGTSPNRKCKNTSYRASLNLYGTTQQYPYNPYAMNTRQALSSLGFDMDAFELADCYGRRINKTPPRLVLPKSSNERGRGKLSPTKLKGEKGRGGKSEFRLLSENVF